MSAIFLLPEVFNLPEIRLQDLLAGSPSPRQRSIDVAKGTLDYVIAKYGPLSPSDASMEDELMTKWNARLLSSLHASVFYRKPAEGIEGLWLRRVTLSKSDVELEGLWFDPSGRTFEFGNVRLVSPTSDWFGDGRSPYAWDLPLQLLCLEAGPLKNDLQRLGRDLLGEPEFVRATRHITTDLLRYHKYSSNGSRSFQESRSQYVLDQIRSRRWSTHASATSLHSRTMIPAPVRALFRKFPIEGSFGMANWLQGRDGRHPEDQARLSRNRVQALNIYPDIFATVLGHNSPWAPREDRSTSESDEQAAICTAISELIDEGQPLSPVVRATLERPVWVDKALQGVCTKFRLKGNLDPYHMRLMSKTLKELGPEWAPNQRELALLYGLSRLRDSVNVRRLVSSEPPKSAQSRWGGLLPKLANLQWVIQLEDTINAASWALQRLYQSCSTSSVEKSFPRHLLIPKLQDRLLRDSYTLTQLNKASIVYHERGGLIRSLGNDFFQKNLIRSWIPLIEPTTIDGVMLESFGDAETLEKHGEAMGHCVGGYAPYCATGSTQIVGLQKSGVWVATAEFKAVDGAWKLAQFAGPNNKEPSKDLQAVKNKFLALIDAGRIQYRSTSDCTAHAAQQQSKVQVERSGNEALFEKYGLCSNGCGTPEELAAYLDAASAIFPAKLQSKVRATGRSLDLKMEFIRRLIIETNELMPSQALGSENTAWPGGFDLPF